MNSNQSDQFSKVTVPAFGKDVSFPPIPEPKEWIGLGAEVLELALEDLRKRGIRITGVKIKLK